jgi:hypothetical protein
MSRSTGMFISISLSVLVNINEIVTNNGGINTSIMGGGKVEKSFSLPEIESALVINNQAISPTNIPDLIFNFLASGIEDFDRPLNISLTNNPILIIVSNAKAIWMKK